MGKDIKSKLPKANNVTIYPNVEIGVGTVLEDGVIIGVPPYGKQPGELKTIIGKNSYIRAYSIIYAGVTIGANFQSGPFVFIRENNELGKDVCVWANSVINPDNKVGDGTRIHVGCFLESTIIGKYVFLAPHVTFTDDPHPSNPPTRQHMRGAVVEDHVMVGGGVTFLPHVHIGRNALIGAGSVVTKDIPSGKVAYGNPAKVVKNIRDVVCERGGKKHYPYRK